LSHSTKTPGLVTGVVGGAVWLTIPVIELMPVLWLTFHDAVVLYGLLL
jgi:hypothetical protein